MKAVDEVPVRVLSGPAEAMPFANMWCAPWFKLDDVSPASYRQDIGASAFFLHNVISPEEAERMIAVADSMGFDRAADAERERQNGALSWVLHGELEAQLIRRLAPHLPWSITVHAPGTSVPALEHLGPSGGTAPWARMIEGAPTGDYELAGLSARSRVYRYESDGRDAFQPHYDEVWPGSSLILGTDNDDSQMHSDSWKYSSAPRGQWAWQPGHRVSHISVLLYLSDDFDGGETVLHCDGGEDGGEPGPGGMRKRVSITPITGSALCFGQDFKLGRSGVSHAEGALLHEGLPLTAPVAGSRPLFMKPAAKYVLRTDVQYTMPCPPAAAPAATIDDAALELKDPQAAQSMTIELSEDPETRAKQLQLLKDYGYDVSEFM